MIRPTLSGLWAAFPDHVQYPTLKDLYSWLGGQAAANINADGFGPKGNTCASRLSVAFNRAGFPINPAIAHSMRALTLQTKDGHHIIVRVKEFREYLLRELGRPTLDRTSPFDSNFAGRKGIIAFSVSGWSDASGHIALFDDRTYREPAHDNYATLAVGGVHTIQGEFWELK